MIQVFLYQTDENNMVIENMNVLDWEYECVRQKTKKKNKTTVLVFETDSSRGQGD